MDVPLFRGQREAQKGCAVVIARNTIPGYLHHPGTYPYICTLDDDLGMKGEIIVLP